MARINFDATNIKPQNLRAVPEGWYHLKIVGSEVHTSKQNPGKCGPIVKLVVEIDGDEHEGYTESDGFKSRVEVYLCINHQNEKAQSIAQRHLSTIVHVLDVGTSGNRVLDDTDELLGGRLMGKLQRRKQDPNDDYPPENDVQGWMAIGAQQKTVQASPGPEVHKVLDQFDGDLIEVRPTDSTTDNQPPAAIEGWN